MANTNDAKPEHVISDADYPQHLVINGLWELPFGQGKALLNSGNRVVRRIVGGWQASWIGTWQSGQALTFSGADRVSVSGNNPHTIQQWFDKTQFVAQQAFTLKTLSSRVADVRGPGINKVDITLTKSIAVTERVSMVLQGEFYNALNTTNFSNPNTSVTSGSFGTITGVLLQPRNIQLSGRIKF